MNASDYAKKIKDTVPAFKGRTITSCCRDFISGLLSTKIKKRFSIEDAAKHPWIVKTKPLIKEIMERNKNDPEKMIMELNNTPIDESFFQERRKIFTVIKPSETSLETIDTQSKEPKDYLLHKRSREVPILEDK